MSNENHLDQIPYDEFDEPTYVRLPDGDVLSQREAPTNPERSPNIINALKQSGIINDETPYQSHELAPIKQWTDPEYDIASKIIRSNSYLIERDGSNALLITHESTPENIDNQIQYTDEGTPKIYGSVKVMGYTSATEMAIMDSYEDLGINIDSVVVLIDGSNWFHSAVPGKDTPQRRTMLKARERMNGRAQYLMSILPRDHEKFSAIQVQEILYSQIPELKDTFQVKNSYESIMAEVRRILNAN